MRTWSRTLWIYGLCGLGLVACGGGDEESSKSSKSEGDDAAESSASTRADEDDASARSEGSASGESEGSAGGSVTGVSLLKPTTAGLCRLESPEASKKACWDYQPRDVDSLEPGTYVLHARLSVARDLSVPLTFDTHCRRAGSDSERKHRDQTVEVSRGSQEDGYRVHYLTLTAPETTWASDCTWSISVPDEHGGELARGSWFFPLS